MRPKHLNYLCKYHTFQLPILKTFAWPQAKHQTKQIGGNASRLFKLHDLLRLDNNVIHKEEYLSMATPKYRYKTF